MSIKISGTTVIDDSRNINAGIATFTRIDVPPTPITFSPANGATGVVQNSNIIITFNVGVTTGTGNITLRSGSAGGTAFSTIGVSSTSVSISGGEVTINPPNDIPDFTTTFVVVDAGAFTTGFTTTSVNVLINDYSFTTTGLALGDSYEGGFLICKASPVRWVVSPRSAEVSRDWYLRGDSVTTAQSVSGCTGWFVPTTAQLQNPGFCCRSFWGPSPCYSEAQYWGAAGGAWFSAAINLTDGSPFPQTNANTQCVRAFRCVTY
jgi:hypothetical protein